MNGLNGHSSPDSGPSSSFQATIAELIGQLQKEGTLSPTKQSDPYKIGQIVMNYVKEAKEGAGSSGRKEGMGSSGSGARNGGYPSSNGTFNGGSFRSEISNRTLPFLAPPRNFQQAFSSRTQQIIKESLQSRKSLTRRSSDSSISMVDDRLGSPDKLRRQLDLKARRKKRRSFIKKMMDGVEQFGIDENVKLSDLPGKIRESFQDMYERGILQVKIYLSAVESLREFFRHKTFPNSVESSVREFLRDNMFKDWRPQVKDSKTEGFQLECETYTLLKMHSLENLEEKGRMTEECRRELADLSKFLQGLKIAVPHLEVEHFLESTVVELFIDTMPECVQELMDQCQVSSLPLEFQLDTHKVEPEEESEPEISISPLKIRSSKSKRRIFNSNRSALHHSARKLSATLDSHSHQSRDKYAKRPRREKDKKRERRIVAETPSSKQVAPSALRRQEILKGTMTSVVEDSPVRQSPRQHPSTLALRNDTSKVSKAHCLLLQRKKLLEKAKAPMPVLNDTRRRSSTNSIPPLLRARRSISSTVVSPQKSTSTVKSPTQPESEIGATEFRSPRTRNTSKAEPWSQEKRRLPSQRAPMKNLNPSLASCSLVSTCDVARGSKRSLKRLEQPATPKTTKTQAPASPVKEPTDEALSDLVSEAVATKYRNYVHKLRASKSKGKLSENNLFYARGSVRDNLFQAVEEDKQAGTSPTVTTRLHSTSSTPNSPPAKNRSGRKVKEPKFSHVANYLLNDKNKDPSSPVIPKFLARKNPSDIRISRLLRYPSRSRRKSMKRNRSDECSVAESHESGNSRESLEAIKQEPSCPASPTGPPLAVDTSTAAQTRDLQTLRVELKKLEIQSLMLSPRNNGLNGISSITKSNGISLNLQENGIVSDHSSARSRSACGSRRHSVNGLMISHPRLRARRSEDDFTHSKMNIPEKLLLSPRKSIGALVDAEMAYTQINGKVSEEKEIPDHEMTSEYGSDMERTSSPIL